MAEAPQERSQDQTQVNSGLAAVPPDSRLEERLTRPLLTTVIALRSGRRVEAILIE